MLDYKGIYTRMFSNPSYSMHPLSEPGYLMCRDELIQIPNGFTTLVDVCAGRGVFMDLLQDSFPHTAITAVDLANFHGKPFPTVFADLSVPEDRERLKAMKFDALTCIGSLEHFEESLMEDVVATLAAMAQWTVVLIGTVSDKWGNEELHVTQKQDDYWRPLFEKYFTVHHYAPTNGYKTVLIYRLESKVFSR